MSRQLHIVHTEASQGWGGQEIRILAEASGMLARGHKITLLSPKTATIYEAARERGIHVVAMPFEKKSLANVRATHSWLSQHRPDVINTHSSIDSWLVGLAQVFRSPKIPVLRTRHISAPVSNNITSRWLYLQSASHIVTTGEKLRLDLISRLGAESGKITSIPTGVDLNRFNRESARSRQIMRSELELPQDAIVIGIAATIRSWKGHDYLLEAFSEIKQRHQNIFLVIAGDGPRRTMIEDLIKPQRLQHSVRLLGQRDDIPDILAALDIFVLPSYANEGVPQAILQAMAMELPVVSTDIGAISEAVIDGSTGLMAQPRDALDLAHKIEQLILQPDLRTKFGAAARRHIVDQFSYDRMIDQMEECFLQLAAP